MAAISRRAKRNSKIDEEIAESFPASDPPAFVAGNIGAPRRKMPRKSAAKKLAKKRK